MVNFNNINLLFTNGITGSTGTTITPTDITTPLLIVNNIVDSTGSTGQNGNVLSYTDNGIRWSVLQSAGITGNLIMNNYDITNAGTIVCTNLNTTTINAPTFTNQIAFSSAPSCSIEPTAANHIATKNYVDTKSANYSVYNLYLNQSQTTTVPLVSGSTGYSILSTLVTSSVQASPITITPTAGTTGAILSFISEPIGITQLPACILNVNIYGTNTTGNFTVYYRCNFRLYSGTGSGITITTLGTSQTSSILNNAVTSPLLYTMSVSVPSRSILSSDRFIIELYAINTSTSTVSISTFFENSFYSYAQLQTNSTIPFQTTYITSVATSDLNMNYANITSTGDMSISCPNKILSLGNKASTINIENHPLTGRIYLGNNNGSSIRLGKPLNIMYDNNGNSTSALGYYYEVSPSGKVPADGIFPTGLISKVRVNFNLLYSGVWLFNTFCGVYSLSAVVKNEFSVVIYTNNSETPSNYLCSQQIRQSWTSGVVNNFVYFNFSGIINITGANTLLVVYTLNRNATTRNGTSHTGSMRLTRIG